MQGIPRLRRGSTLNPVALASCVVLVLALATGCSRELTVAPQVGATSGRAAQVTWPTSGPESEVMVTLGEGVDVVEVAVAYGATIGKQEYWGCATLIPMAGESPAALTQRLEGDSRVITAEPNGYMESPESRQPSFAFDDRQRAELSGAECGRGRRADPRPPDRQGRRRAGRDPRHRHPPSPRPRRTRHHGPRLR
jgi:hypothetical protein